MIRNKMTLIVAAMSVIGASVFIVTQTSKGERSVKLPSGYCKVENRTFVMGQGPSSIAIDDTKKVNLVLVDIKQGSSTYFANEEINPQQNTFTKVVHAKDEDTKLWQDTLLLRTTIMNTDSTELLIAKKCS